MIETVFVYGMFIAFLLGGGLFFIDGKEPREDDGDRQPVADGEEDIIRDGEALLAAGRACGRNFLIAYTPLEIFGVRTGVAVKFPPEKPDEPGEAQIRSFEYLLHNLDEDMEAEIVGAMYNYYRHRLLDTPGADKPPSPQEFLEKLVLPAFIAISPDGEDGFAYVTVGFFTRFGDPHALRVKMIRGEILEVGPGPKKTDGSQPRTNGEAGS